MRLESLFCNLTFCLIKHELFFKIEYFVISVWISRHRNLSCVEENGRLLRWIQQGMLFMCLLMDIFTVKNLSFANSIFLRKAAVSSYVETTQDLPLGQEKTEGFPLAHRSIFEVELTESLY